MAPDSLLFPAVVFSFLCSGALAEKLLRMECQPAVGEVGKTMKVSCSFRSALVVERINIDKVSVFKSDPDNPVFSFRDDTGTGTGDPRFKLPSVNNPSLELANTAISDEGKYKYQVITDRGVIDDGSFSIRVTAKYSQPTMSSRPEVIEDGSSADLYCKTSGGYPAGAIHWYDKTNTNWTRSATLEVTEGEDRLVQMSSKLTFSQIDSSWAPFRCVVLNGRFIPEGESHFQPKIKEGQKGASRNDEDKTTSINVVAPVVVIGSLLVGLLLLILLRGHCRPQTRRPSALPFLSHSSDQFYAPHDEPDVEKALSPPQPKEEAEVKTHRSED